MQVFSSLYKVGSVGNITCLKRGEEHGKKVTSRKDRTTNLLCSIRLLDPYVVMLFDFS